MYRALVEGEMDCVQCGASFIGDGRRRRFCSAACRNTNYLNTYVKGNPKTVMASATVGAVSELIVCADLLKRGKAVFRAVSASCSCDLAILDNSGLKRVEVTTGHLSPTGKLMHPSKAKEKYDILAVVTMPSGSITYTPEP
jgi:hypothetical protein